MKVTKAIPGIERFYYKYPDYPNKDICGWFYVAESEGQLEGDLRDCLECDGREYTCGSYSGRT